MILDTIVDRKRQEVANLKRQGIHLPEAFRGSVIEPPRGFRQALLDSGFAIIAEVKKASPSKGVIVADFDPVRIARNYHRQGAAAISVLTDVDFFQGALLHLMKVREAVPLPVLRKDFIIDEIQVREAAAHGADAILLIAAILDVEHLSELRQQARQLGMDVLVEVHDETEAEAALRAGADLVGVNNRDLKTFAVDIAITHRVKRIIPAGIPVVSESGLAAAADFRLLAENGVGAALVGESLMRAGAESDLLQSFLPQRRPGR